MRELIDKKSENEKLILRVRVLDVVNDSPVKLTGREIAKRACLEYKQTIDALNALNNHGKIQRIGKKFNTRWIRLGEDNNVDAMGLLSLALFKISRKRILRDKFRR